MTHLHREKVDAINLCKRKVKLDFIHIDYYDQYSETFVNQIYDLLIDDKIDFTNESKDYIIFLGYYYYFKNDIENTKKYFQKGIDNNYSQSYVDMALLLLSEEDDRIKIKELLLKAVEMDDLYAKYRLAMFYVDNVFNDEPEFCDKESDKLFDELIEKKYFKAMDFLGEFYLERNPEKAFRYFNMMVENGYMHGNFGIIKLGCSKEREKELLTEVVVKWDINICSFRNMSSLFSLLLKNNVDSKLLLEHCNRIGLKNDDLKLKIQAEENILKSKMKFAQFGECPVCMEEKDLILFDCFSHLHCIECDRRMDKCSLCRVTKNQLINID